MLKIRKREKWKMQNNSIKDPKALALLERIQQAREYTAVLQQLWLLLGICECAPSNAQFALWLSRHTFGTVEAAIQETAVWLSKLRTGNASQEVVENRKAVVGKGDLKNLTHDQKVRYCSGVMNKMVQP